MKNIVIGLIVLLAAAFFYLQLQSTPTEELDSGKAKTNTPLTEPTKTTNPLASEAASNARVFIIEPIDGATLSSPIKVVFGIENMAIAPAGQDLPNSGHHHLLVDHAELPPLDIPLPASDTLIHFGKGQTETSIELEPGNHSLQLLLGNYLHIPHNQAVVSDKISISVTQ